MLGSLPHSLSDSTGQQALRPGSRRPARSPRQDITLGMPCRRVSVGGAAGGTRAGWVSPMRAGSCCGAQDSIWHGAWGVPAWHLPSPAVVVLRSIWGGVGMASPFLAVLPS